MPQILKHYRNDDALRRSFNDLAEATFGLNFENWYQNGFWGDNYDPYSILEDGRIVANVSVNRTDMVIGSETRRLYQLGTVMTDPEYRGRGYIRSIMEEVETDTADADGIYLFANDSVLEFYPKFGFTEGTEHVYSKTVSQTGTRRVVNVPMDGPEAWAQLRRAMEENTFRGGCDMVGNPGLIFFYASQFLSGCVYRCDALNAWVIAEEEDGELLIHNVFSVGDISLDAVIETFGPGVHRVTLGFTPADPNGWECHILKEEDSTFFVQGPAFQDFAAQKLRIPTLAHA